MKKPKKTRLVLNKVKISRIQNASLLFGGSYTDPDERDDTVGPESYPTVNSHEETCTGSLGVGEVTTGNKPETNDTNC